MPQVWHGAVRLRWALQILIFRKHPRSRTDLPLPSVGTAKLTGSYLGKHALPAPCPIPATPDAKCVLVLEPILRWQAGQGHGGAVGHVDCLVHVTMLHQPDLAGLGDASDHLALSTPPWLLP